MKRVNPTRKNLHPTPYTPHPVSGFSIIETIVAIAILSIAMVAPLSLAQRGLNASAYARDQVTAFYLAQEAVEYVRNVRDTNNLAGNSGGPRWLEGLQECLSPGVCGIDATNGAVFDCAKKSSADCLLTYKAQGGLYGSIRDGNGNPNSGAVNSIFQRKIQIKKVSVEGNQEGEADIAVTVTWMSGIIPKTISIQEKIFNWYPPKVL